MENKPAREILAARLIELREGNGLTQQELADKLNITRQSLSLYERAERTINIDLLLEISKVFDVSTDYLLGVSDCKTTDADIKEVCDFVNLSERAVYNIHEFTETFCPVVVMMSGGAVFNQLCETEHLLSFCSHLSAYWKIHRLYDLNAELLKRQKSRGDKFDETEKEYTRLKEDIDYMKWRIVNYVYEIIDSVFDINKDYKVSSLSEDKILWEIDDVSLYSTLKRHIKEIEYIKSYIDEIRNDI